MNWVVNINEQKVTVKLPKNILSGGEQIATIDGEQYFFRYHDLTGTISVKTPKSSVFENFPIRAKSLLQFSGESQTLITGEYVREAKAHSLNAYVELSAPGSENRKTSSTSGASKLRSPMTGTVIKLHASEGDTVNEGDLLMVIEAMKMENQIIAPTAGTINKLHIKQGDSVQTGKVMVEF